MAHRSQHSPLRVVCTEQPRQRGIARQVEHGAFAADDEDGRVLTRHHVLRAPRGGQRGHNLGVGLQCLDMVVLWFAAVGDHGPAARAGNLDLQPVGAQHQPRQRKPVDLETGANRLATGVMPPFAADR